MFEPGRRRLFLNALRPPEGYSFDVGVGTTYTLDLMALLAVPLAFTFRDAHDGDGQLASDPLAILESSRRHASNLVLFCHGGQTAVPRSRQPVLTFLEQSVVTAHPPRIGEARGVFHPKIWVLRYVAVDRPVRYRLVCQSRNLTFDASWDTSLVLDGQLEERRDEGFAVNSPLVDFVKSLREISCQPLAGVQAKIVDTCVGELPRVRFHPPEGLDLRRFLSFGFGPSNPDSPDLKRRPILVISPFLDGEFLRSVASRRPRSVLVSRREALLAASPGPLSSFDEIYAFRSGLEPEAEDGDEDLALFSGLHAKVYVIDDGWDARVVVGSANSTAAALASPPRNVEFMVELVGKKSRFGIDALLKPREGGDTGTFRSLIEPFDKSELGTAEEDEEAGNLDLLLEDVAASLARADIRGMVEPSGNDYVMQLESGDPPDLPEQVKEVACWPASPPDSRRKFLADGVEFTGLSMADLSCFLAVEIRASVDGKSGNKRFVRPIRVGGMPEDRLPRLLASMLTDRGRLMQLLWLLLSPNDDLSFAEFGQFFGSADGRRDSTLTLPGLMERMLETLHSGPDRRDSVATLVEDLRKTEAGAELLDPEFDAVWEPIWKVRQSRK